MKVIIEHSHGSSSLYVATLENALKLFKSNIEDYRFEPIEWKPPYFSKSLLMKRAKDVLFSKEVNGLLISQEMKSMLFQFLFEHEIPIIDKSFSEYHFLKAFSFEKLPFFKEMDAYKNKENLIFLSDYLIDRNRDYQTIINDSFKEETSNEKKIKFILSFINQIVDSSNLRYELSDIKETV